MRAVALWLGFVAFVVVCYIAGCGAPVDTADGLACGAGISCACWYDVQYHTIPQCAPESDFMCAPDSCTLAEHVTLTCHNGLHVTLDVTEGLAHVTTADGCTETLPVTVRYGTYRATITGMNPNRTTRPATPAALARNAGRYSLVANDRDRPTLPPEPAELEAVQSFERAIATHGESQARLQNLERKTRP